MDYIPVSVLSLFYFKVPSITSLEFFSQIVYDNTVLT